VKAVGPRAARPIPLPAPPAPPTGLAWSLRGALAGNFALRFAGAATGILLTRYLAHINDTGRPIGAGVVALLTAGFYATELVGSPLLGAVGDRRGRRALLLLGPLLGALALGLTAATTLLAVLLLTRLLEGLSAAAAVPAILGHLGEATDGDDALRGRALSVFEATTALGTLVGVAAAAGPVARLGSRCLPGHRRDLSRRRRLLRPRPRRPRAAGDQALAPVAGGAPWAAAPDRFPPRLALPRRDHRPLVLARPLPDPGAATRGGRADARGPGRRG